MSLTLLFNQSVPGNLAFSAYNVMTGRVHPAALTNIAASGFNGMRARVTVGTFTPIGQLQVTGLNVSFSGIIVETISLPNPSRILVVYP